MMTNILKNKNPDVERIFNADLLNKFKLSKQQINVPAGSLLYRESDKCENFVLLIKGTLRVFKKTDNGREITIYRVSSGEQCVLSLQSMLSGENCFANAIAETELTFLSLNKTEFYQLLDESNEFQKYLLKYMSQNLYDIVTLVSEVTFKQINARLASTLRTLFKQSASESIAVTHGQLAKELGTTREVISRALKDLESHQCIKLLRGRINLLSPESLDWLSQ